ncbi:hypothetical protein CV093_18185 [Oceanobacillus sp. 143]|nr:hypothetical protein CV093_18185 [Oceanobacillus sp. 143]
MAGQFDNAVFSPKVENWELAIDPLREATNSVLLGQEEVKKALEKAEEEANKHLEK